MLKNELFRVITEQITIFIDNFNKYRKVNRQILQSLCNFFIDFQFSFAMEFNYVKPPEYFTSNIYTNESNLETSMYKKSLFINNINTRKDYLLIFKNFLIISQDLASILNSSDLSNYDFEDDSINNRVKEFIDNKKMIICKFYHNLIIKMVLEDIRIMLMKRLKRGN